MNELPEEGELVLATVKDVTQHGAYVTLDEYNNMTGFLHVSEITTGWVRNIERFVREGQKIVLKVIRVDKARNEVDLSLKQVTDDERRRKLVEVKKEERARSYLEIIKTKCNYTDEMMEECIKIIKKEYPLLYDIFEEAAKNSKTLKKINLPKEIKDAILEICSNIKIPSVEVRGIMEITCMKPNGIDIIRKALTSVEDENVSISYIGAPKYRIMVRGENFKVAEKLLSKSIDNIKSMITKGGGTFNFVREESKKGVT